MMSESRLASFCIFVAMRGHSESNVTVALKIEWLLDLIQSSGPLSRGTFARCVRALEEIGPADPAERQRQAIILHAFARRVREGRTLAPPGPHCCAMPLPVLKGILSLCPGGRGRLRLSRQRLRTQLQVAWSTGLRLRELRGARRDWLIPHPQGFLLRVAGPHARATRLLAIPQLTDPSICAATGLEEWLRVLPDDSHGYLFPKIDHRGKFHHDRPFNITCFTDVVRERLKRLGYRQYRYSSIRIAFLSRCFHRLGEAAAYHVAGYRHFHSLRSALEAETAFITFPIDRKT